MENYERRVSLLFLSLLIELTEVSIMEIEENQSEVYPDYSCNAKSVSWYYSD